MKIPRDLQKTYDEISKLLIDYSAEYLNKEYEGLCLNALEKLCHKRPSPLKSGRSNTWAAGIVYAIAPFGVATSTASSKAAIIRKLLKIDYLHAEWCLPSEIAANPMLWMVSINGLYYDARMLSVEIQKTCYEKGLIPYIPEYKNQNT